MHLNRAVVAASDRYLLVHAARGHVRRFGPLLPASDGFGQDHTRRRPRAPRLELSHHEAAAINPTTLAIDPFPSRLSIELGSWDALEYLRPELDARFAHFGRRAVARGARGDSGRPRSRARHPRVSS